MANFLELMEIILFRRNSIEFHYSEIFCDNEIPI